MQMCEFHATEVGGQGHSRTHLSTNSSHPCLPPTVVFPQDLLEKGLEADNFAMLGLGDIVIPGERAGPGTVG